MEKEVIIQLKVARPRDQAAWTETTRVAAALESKFKDVGTAGGKALSDVSAKAQRLAADSKKSSDAVTVLMREIAKGSREAGGIERISRQLRSMGVDATRASEAAAKLMRSLGDGARLAEGDLRRLATVLRATGGGSPGLMGRLGGFLGQPLAGASLGTLGAMQLGGRVIGAAGQAFRQSLMTPADAQIQDMLRDRRQGFGPGSAFLADLHTNIPIMGGVRDWMTHSTPGSWDIPNALARGSNALFGTDLQEQRGSREGVVDSERRLQRQLANAEFARQQRQIRGAANIAGQTAQSQGFRDFSLAGISGTAGIIGARESVGQFRADRRFDALQQRLALQMEGVGRGEALGGGVIEALRGEVANRPAFGQAERYRIGQERTLVGHEMAAARRAFDNAGAGGGDATMEQNAARQQMVEAQQRLIELERRDVELTRQAAEAEQQRLERFRQFAQTAEEGYRRIAQAERDRVSTFREQFGLMNELDRAQLQQLARRASERGGAGIQNLSGEELQRLQATGLFGEQVRAEAGRRSELAGIQGIIQASGVEGRIAAAEGQQRAAAQIRTQIENQITVNMTASAKEMAAQIARQLQPAIAQLTVQIVAGVRAQLDDALAEAEWQRNLQRVMER